MDDLLRRPTQASVPMDSFHKELPMATDPNEHPAHKVPETYPLPPGDLPPSTETPTIPPQPQLPQSGPDYVGEIEDEGADPVGPSPRTRFLPIADVP